MVKSQVFEFEYPLLHYLSLLIYLLFISINSDFNRYDVGEEEELN